MIIRNPTHYFNETTKRYNVVPDPNFFSSQEYKKKGYYQRLYWEFEYTKLVGGQSMYVTCTYNEKSCPVYKFKTLSFRCFDYSHVRELTNGIIKERLFRKYGTSMRYFCACETDSDGMRGKGNNPHYHLIFFLHPCPHTTPQGDYVPYKPITQSEFLDLVREVWQGRPGFSLWKYCKYGSVKPGKYGLLITQNKGAFRYVSKYCTKSQSELSFESKFRELLYDDFMSGCLSLSNLFRYWNKLKNDNPSMTESQFGQMFDLPRFWSIVQIRNDYQYTDFLELADDFVVSNVHAYKRWYEFNILPELIEARVSEFRRKYSAKVRCSKSLGSYGLRFIENVDTDPRFKMVEQDGPKSYVPTLYYQRKLYYHAVKCSHTGNILYILNDLGRKYRVNSLSKTISRYYRNFLENVSRMFENDIRFDYGYSKLLPVSFDPDRIGSVGLHYNSSFDNILYMRNLQASSDYLSIVYKYAVYHCVYQFRGYDSSTPIALTDDFRLSDIQQDYDMFLRYTAFYLDYDDLTVSCVFEKCPGCLSVDNLPYFSKYRKIFDVFDTLMSSVDEYMSDLRKVERDEDDEVKKRLNTVSASLAVC